MLEVLAKLRDGEALAYKRCSERDDSVLKSLKDKNCSYERVYVVSDIHCDADFLMSVLVDVSELLLPDLSWNPKMRNVAFVIVGDLLDRHRDYSYVKEDGSQEGEFDEEEELCARLYHHAASQALQHGSRCFFVCGNHEQMNLLGDYQSVRSRHLAARRYKVGSEVSGSARGLPEHEWDSVWYSNLNSCGVSPMVRLNNLCFTHGAPQPGATVQALQARMDAHNMRDKLLAATLWDRKLSDAGKPPPCALLKQLEPKNLVVVLGHTPQLSRVCTASVRHFTQPDTSPSKGAFAFRLNTRKQEADACPVGTWIPHGVTAACPGPDGNPRIYMVDVSGSRSFDQKSYREMDPLLIPAILAARRPAVLVFTLQGDTYVPLHVLVAKRGLSRTWYQELSKRHGLPEDEGSPFG